MAKARELAKLITDNLVVARDESKLVKALDSRPHLLLVNTLALQDPVLSKIKSNSVNKAKDIIQSSVRNLSGAIRLRVNRDRSFTALGSINVKSTRGDFIKISKGGRIHFSDFIYLPYPIVLVSGARNVPIGALFSSFGTVQAFTSKLSRQISSLIDTDLLSFAGGTQSYKSTVNKSNVETSIAPGLDVGHALSEYSQTPLSIQYYAMKAMLKAFITDTPDTFDENIFKELVDKDLKILTQSFENQDDKAVKLVNDFTANISKLVQDIDKLSNKGVSALKELRHEVNAGLTQLESLHAYGAKIEITMNKVFGKENAAILSSTVNVVLLQDSLENRYYWGNKVEGALKRILTKAVGTLAEAKFSPSLIDNIKQKISNIISGKPVSTNNSKANFKENVDKSITKAISTSSTTPTPVKKPRVPKKEVLKPINLVSVQQLINAQLAQRIKANMVAPALRNRTGRFAESAKVERLSESRAGMITAFYSYMKSPYQTFQPGFHQGSEKRNPKTLISKSIREIASTIVGNRLRSVLI